MTNMNRVSILGLVASDASYRRKSKYTGITYLGPFTDEDADEVKGPDFEAPSAFVNEASGFEYFDVVEDDETGFGAALFFKRAKGEVIVALRGTDGPSAQDWSENLRG
jgi:hypothetical protein